MSLRELRETLKTCSGWRESRGSEHIQVQAHQTLAPSAVAAGRKPPKTSLREQEASLEHLYQCSSSVVQINALNSAPLHVISSQILPAENPNSTSALQISSKPSTGAAWKPPKTSLREQIASLEHLLQPSVPKEALKSAPRRVKSCPSPGDSSPNPNSYPMIALGSRHTSTGALAENFRVPRKLLRGSGLKCCSDSGIKRHADGSALTGALAEGNLLVPGKFSRGLGLSRCNGRASSSNPGIKRQTDNELREEEVHHVKRRRVEVPESARPKEEEEGDGHLQDSEAGLFIQSEREGPYEPLVLWPLPGEGSSSGVDAARIVQVPASINSRLLPHQREGVRFLYNLYREDRGGILGDDMGLGKTIQTIALIAALLQRDDATGRTHLCHGRAAAVALSEGVMPLKKVFLILCPTSVIQNWEQEFQAWGTFKIGIYHGVNRDTVLSRVEANDLEVVLTSHDMFRINVTTLCAINWDCVIVDEAHRLKNERSQLYKTCVKLRTKRRYGLTGTIMQNKYIELFNVFDWASPNSLGPREHFLEYYGEPLKQGQRISAPERFVRIAEERKQHLVKVLSRHLLRRTKQQTIGHLMQGKADNVVFCKMSDVQIRVYRRLLQSPDFQLLISKDKPCSCGSRLTRVECCHRTASDGVIWSYLHRENPDGCEWCPFCIVLPCLTKLQQVSNHLELIKPSGKDDPEKQKKDEEFASAALGEDAVLVGGLQQDESFMGLSNAQHCGKMRALENLLATWLTKGDKVLLFSYSVKMLDILDRFMIRKGYSFCRLDGSTPMGSRQGLVDEFNNSPSKQVFLISTRAGGLGLNLVSANRVVIFDPNWNPAQDLQAQDRSFRFGQRRHVTVYRLLAAGSIEELIYSRQIYKQQLFNIGVNGTFEKRYFEGVQDSKFHKGELFGISNLFKDLLDKVFTSDIIEKHDERVTRINQKGVVPNTSGFKILEEQTVVDDGHPEELWGGNTHDLVEQNGPRGQILPTTSDSIDNDSETSATEEWRSGSDAEDFDDIQNDSEEQYKNLLKDSGVVYAHRNEEVVNLGAGLRKPGALKSPRDDEESIQLEHKMEATGLHSSSIGQRSSISKATIVKESESPKKSSPMEVPPIEDCHKSETSAAQRKTTHEEDIAESEAMDENTKWLFSAVGLFPARLLQDHSLL